MTDACPSATTLRTFGLGLLPEADAWPIEAHLASCLTCAESLEATLPTDELLATLRTPAGAIAVDDPLLSTLSGRLRALVPAPVLAPRREDLHEPRVLGRYELQAVVGRGGMGVVYRAFDPQLKRTVALKVLLDHRFADPVQQARFQREAETLAQLHHPAIVSIHEVGTHDDRPYLALEYIDGGTLAEQLQGQPQPIAASVALVRRLAEAVHYAHTQGVIHRDLKPSNILGAAWEHAKISDFGLARRLDETGLTETGAIVGTPGYLAPEQMVSHAAIGPTADVYSLGALLYELLTGRPPFRGENVLDTLEQARTTDPVPPRRLRASVPRDLETIVLKCLRREPRKRYATAAELNADLERFERGEPIHAKHAGYIERLCKWVRRNPMATALIIVFLGAAVALAIAQQRTKRALAQAEANETKAKHASERATTNYQAARDTLQQMLRRTSDPGRGSVPGVRSLSRQQQEDALAFYLAVAAQAGDDPAIKFDAAQAHYAAAKLQSDFGRNAEAHQNSLKAQQLYGELVALDGTNAKYRCGYLETWLSVIVHHDVPKAKPALLVDIAKQAEALVRDFPNHAPSHSILASVLHNQGFFAYWDDKKADATVFFRAAVTAHEQCLKLEPDNREAQLATANALLNLHLLAHQQGLPEVQDLGERADGLLLQLHRADPSDLHSLTRLGDHRTNAAYSLFNAGHGDKALQRLTEVIELLEVAYKNEPNYLILARALYTTNGARAEVCAGMQRFDLAVTSWRRVVALVPDEERPRRHSDLIHALLKAKQFTEAFKEAEQLIARTTATPHAYAFATSIKAAVLVQSAKALEWGQQAKAERMIWASVRKQLLDDTTLADWHKQPEIQRLPAD